MMEYRGYVGIAEFDDEAGILHGEVINIKDVITFQGKSVDELRTAFKDSIDDYIEFCEERGEEPDKPFSGKVMLRMTPEQHRLISLAAKKSGKSLNRWVAERINRDAQQELGLIASKIEKIPNPVR
jgi:predicted HicB family RNase H-like nuclease